MVFRNGLYIKMNRPKGLNVNDNNSSSIGNAIAAANW